MIDRMIANLQKNITEERAEAFKLKQELEHLKIQRSLAQDQGKSDAEKIDCLCAENLRLRKIAAHVPAKIYIAAKEAAGYGQAIQPMTPNV